MAYFSRVDENYGVGYITHIIADMTANMIAAYYDRTADGNSLFGNHSISNIHPSCSIEGNMM